MFKNWKKNRIAKKYVFVLEDILVVQDIIKNTKIEIQDSQSLDTNQKLEQLTDYNEAVEILDATKDILKSVSERLYNIRIEE
jgi:hypothetical protein